MSENSTKPQIRQLLENYYDIQKIRIESHNKVVSWIKENPEIAKSYIEKCIENINDKKSKDSQEFKDMLAYIEHKKYAVIAKRIFEGRIDPYEIKDVIWFHNRLIETEKELGRRLDKWSEDIQIRKEFLSRVKGIGGVLSSGLIAWIEPISRFDNISKLWAYSGLSPHNKRVKGKKINYNPKMKNLCWKIWNSFVKRDCFGRKLYIANKEYCEQTHPDWSKGHIHNWSGRKTAKIFLACLWIRWRELEDLPVSKPYIIDIMKHSDMIDPDKWLEK